MSSSDRCDQVTTSYVSTSEVEGKLCVDSYKVLCEVSDKDSADNLEVNLDEFCWESDINKFWEVEIDCPASQITDVQCWLRKSKKF